LVCYNDDNDRLDNSLKGEREEKIVESLDYIVVGAAAFCLFGLFLLYTEYRIDKKRKDATT
jgi:hypothetical protein